MQVKLVKSSQQPKAAPPQPSTASSLSTFERNLRAEVEQFKAAKAASKPGGQYRVLFN